jgi:predicted anti-sigma-YlaC factor YlaD
MPAVHMRSDPVTNRPIARRPGALLPGVVALALVITGCSVRKYAMKSVADALSQAGTTFSSDSDPELVREAVPFSLKLMETVLAETPRHRGLLLAICGSFTQYAYAFIQQSADEADDTDFSRAEQLRTRARGLYLRARDYGLRGLDVGHRDFESKLRRNPLLAVASARAEDVGLLYWTAAAWGSAISIGKTDTDLIADQPVVEALIDRAYALAPDHGDGALEGLLITYEPARQGAKGDAAERSKKHYLRALELTRGQLASPHVAYAEAVCVGKQDRDGFQDLLRKALAVDPDARPEWRLQNLIAQRRARWLLSRLDAYFLEAAAPAPGLSSLSIPLPW